MIHAAIETADSVPTPRDGVANALPRTNSSRLRQIPLDGARDGELRFQRCRWCQTPVFRRLLCPVCASTDLAYERSGDIGVVRHVTIVGRSNGAPRALAIIDMSEGFRVQATVSAVPPDMVHIGAQVRLAADAGPNARELVFRLCDVPRGDER